MARSRGIPPVSVVEDDPAFSTGSKDGDKAVVVGNISGERLRAIIERIERLQAEIRSQQEDIKEIKSEAKGIGFDVKVINHLIRERKQDADDLAEFEQIVATYKRAIGMSK